MVLFLLMKVNCVLLIAEVIIENADCIKPHRMVQVGANLEGLSKL